MRKVFHIPPDGSLYDGTNDCTYFLCGEKWNVHQNSLMQEVGHPADCDACILIAFSKGIKIK